MHFGIHMSHIAPWIVRKHEVINKTGSTQRTTTPSEDGNMHYIKFGEVRSCGVWYMRADKQTYLAYHNILHPSLGGLSNNNPNLSNWGSVLPLILFTAIIAYYAIYGNLRRPLSLTPVRPRRVLANDGGGRRIIDVVMFANIGLSRPISINLSEASCDGGDSDGERRRRRRHRAISAINRTTWRPRRKTAVKRPKIMNAITADLASHVVFTLLLLLLGQRAQFASIADGHWTKTSFLTSNRYHRAQTTWQRCVARRWYEEFF